VLPLPFGQRPLPGPTLVELEVHDIRPVPLDLNSGNRSKPSNIFA
jgi:hypothetical protein